MKKEEKLLFRAKNCCRLSLKKLRIHRSMLAKILKVGIPAALQMAVTAFSNVFVQSYINSFGEDCMGGWTAYVKIDVAVVECTAVSEQGLCSFPW